MPLGIPEYFLVIQALQGGFGLPDLAALQRLCRALWVKNASDEQLLAYHFAKVFAIPEETDPVPSYAANPSQSFQQATPRTMSDLDGDLNEEAQISLPIKGSVVQDTVFMRLPTVLPHEYQPATQRQFKQNIRHLRRYARSGPAEELDLDATIGQIARDGFLLQPTLVPRRTNTLRFTLLLDHDGSMVPFHYLTRRLVETFQGNSDFHTANIYYFHNCPIEYVYRDIGHQNAMQLDHILEGKSRLHDHLIVVSDAGAARGGLNQNRLQLTHHFLTKAHQHMHVMWLNPLPRGRWVETSAATISTWVAMFDMSRVDMSRAINQSRRQ